MKTSVLMSAYKGERFIRQQLNSIVNQTQIPDELIIIDDCSPDDGTTIKIIKEYQNKYDYIRLFINPKNLGWAKSFMNGLNQVTGDVLFFADQDDVWELNKIETMVSLFEDEMINGVISGCQNVDINLSSLDCCSNTGRLIKNKYPFDKHFIYPKGVGAAMAFRMDFINKYKHLWVKGFGHDRFFQVILIMFDRLYFLDLPLIKHRMHGDNATAGKHYDTEGRINTLDGNLHFLRFLLDSGMKKELSKEKIALIQDYIEFAVARRDMLHTKSIFKWMAMPTKDLAFYPTKNTWLGDLKCIVK